MCTDVVLSSPYFLDCAFLHLPRGISYSSSTWPWSPTTSWPSRKLATQRPNSGLSLPESAVQMSQRHYYLQTTPPECVTLSVCRCHTMSVWCVIWNIKRDSCSRKSFTMAARQSVSQLRHVKFFNTAIWAG